MEYPTRLPPSPRPTGHQPTPSNPRGARRPCPEALHGPHPPLSLRPPNDAGTNAAASALPPGTPRSLFLAGDRPLGPSWAYGNTDATKSRIPHGRLTGCRRRHGPSHNSSFSRLRRRDSRAPDCPRQTLPLRLAADPIAVAVEGPNPAQAAAGEISTHHRWLGAHNKLNPTSRLTSCDQTSIPTHSTDPTPPPAMPATEAPVAPAYSAPK